MARCVIAVVVAVWPALPAVARDAARGRKQLAPFVDGLRSLGLFAAAEELVLEQLAAAVTEVRQDPGVTVIREGDEADDLYVVRTGTLDVLAAGAAGGTPRRITTIGPGDWFGEIGLLESRPRNATVTTKTSVVLWRIPGDVFLAAFETASLRPDTERSGIAVRVPNTYSRREAATAGAQGEPI